MKQKIILIVLALCMCTIGVDNINAQTKKPVRKATTQVRKSVSSAKPTQKSTREYKVEDDGTEWYLVSKNGKQGIEDKSGNVIIPCEYSHVFYKGKNEFIVSICDYDGLYNINGRCIIPITRKYGGGIYRTDDKKFGTYYLVRRANHEYPPLMQGICDSNGKEILFKEDAYDIHPYFYKDPIFYYEFEDLITRNKGIMDGRGNVVVKPTQKKDLSYDTNEGYFYYSDNGRHIVEYVSPNSLKYNPFAGNAHSSVSSQNPTSSTNTQSTSSGNNSNSSGSGSGTTTVVIEHHHDPVPVQQWQTCFACGGMGTMGCDFCGGSGTKYIGDRLHRCSRCNGQGIIPCNICYGNKGKYITVYQ